MGGKQKPKWSVILNEIGEEKISKLKLNEAVLKLCDKLDRRLSKLSDPKEQNRLRKNYWRDHEFLSQQIDERSHQVFTMGPLLVPISFLIFTYAVVNKVADTDGFLLMLASLTCYASWFIFYKRVQTLNKASYTYIHAYELVLGLSCHLTLKEFYDGSPLIQKTKHIFSITFGILASLWTSYLISKYSSAPLIGELGVYIGAILYLVFCFTPIIIVVAVVRLLPQKEKNSESDQTNSKTLKSRNSKSG